MLTPHSTIISAMHYLQGKMTRFSKKTPGKHLGKSRNTSGIPLQNMSGCPVFVMLNDNRVNILADFCFVKSVLWYCVYFCLCMCVCVCV